jgi:hypothetical protein
MATKQVAIGAEWPEERVGSSAIAWPIWASVVGVTSAIIGGHWDISWHRSIGRDDFWTPPHLAIYMCGILAGLSCAWLILRTTFDKATAALNDTVKIWGFRGPLGAFIIAWGGVAMLTSAPFDDWWHSAYGLDTKILSPPHVLLILGIFGIQTGTLMLILGQMNRAEGDRRKLLEKLFLYVGGMILCLMMILILEFTSRTLQHTPLFYRAVSLAAAPVLVGVAHASRHRWGATIAASIYTAVMLGLIWILPLFPASPKLGPVYNLVTHLVPPQFPILLIIPALAIDWLRAAIAPRGLKPWAHSLLLGALFVAVLIAVQWPFANFLMSDGAKNWFFGAHYFDYSEGPQRMIRRGLFYAFEKTPAEFWQAMGIAAVCSVVMTRLGFAWGSWMRGIVR